MRSPTCIATSLATITTTTTTNRNGKQMSHAILITGQTNQADTLKQIIIANHNGKNYAWSRTTNGGRGESNAWFDNDYADVLSALHYENIVGEVLSSPLTVVDTTAIENNERPNVLIQKLSKQFGLRHKNLDTTRTIDDVVKEVSAIINSNPNDLDKYRSDGRKDKSVTNTKPISPITTATIQSTQQVVQVVRAPKEYETTSDYSLHIPTQEQIGHYIERVLSGGINENKMFKKE